MSQEGKKSLGSFFLDISFGSSGFRVVTFQPFSRDERCRAHLAGESSFAFRVGNTGAGSAAKGAETAEADERTVFQGVFGNGIDDSGTAQIIS